MAKGTGSICLAHKVTQDRDTPTAAQLLSVKEAAVSSADGPRKAMHWLILRTRETSMPFSTRASAAGPAIADTASAAIGGASDTCAQSRPGSMEDPRRCRL